MKDIVSLVINNEQVFVDRDKIMPDAIGQLEEKDVRLAGGGDDSAAAAVKIIKNLFSGTPSDCHTKSVLETIEHIPEEKREQGIVACVSDMFRKIKSDDTKKSFSHMVGETAVEKRENFIKQLNKLLDKIVDKRYIEKIMEKLKSIPVGERLFVAEKMFSILSRVEFDHIMCSIINDIIATPAEEIMDVLTRSMDILKGVRDEKITKIVIDMVSIIPPDERGNIEEIKAIVNTRNISQLVSVASFFRMVPPGERKMVIKRLASRQGLGRDIGVLLREDDHIKEAIHKYLSDLLDKIVEDKRRAFSFSHTIVSDPKILSLYPDHPLFEKAKELQKIFFSWDITKKFAEKGAERFESRILLDVEDAKEAKEVDEVFKKTPIEEREELLKLTKRLLEGLRLGYGLNKIVEIIRNVPVKDRAKIVESARYLSRSVMNITGVRSVLEAITCVSAEERAKVLEVAEILSKGIGDGSKIKRVIEEFVATPVKERAEILELRRNMSKEGEKEEDIRYAVKWKLEEFVEKRGGYLRI